MGRKVSTVDPRLFSCRTITPSLDQMIAHRPEKIPVDLPIRIVRAYVTLILIDEMRRIAHDQIPHFRTRNAFEVIGLINRNAVAEFIQAHRLLARRNRRRVDVGQAKSIAKTIAKH